MLFVAHFLTIIQLLWWKFICPAAAAAAVAAAAAAAAADDDDDVDDVKILVKFMKICDIKAYVMKFGRITGGYFIKRILDLCST